MPGILDFFDGISNFLRDLEPRPKSEPAENWDLVDQRLDEFEQKLRSIEDITAVNQQALLDAFGQVMRRLDDVERRLAPEEVPRYKAVLKRLKDLALFVIAAIAGASVGALPQKLVEDEAYAPFKVFLEHIEQAIARWETPSGPSVVSARGLEPELVLVPAGPFLMGSDKWRDPKAYDRELPQHTVHLDAFYIARHPITSAQYRRFVDATGHRAPDHWKDKDYDPAARADHPVVDVSWHDAVAYCRWLSEQTGKPYSLPSEAEWEKAARGTDGRIYPWGDREPTPNLCNFEGSSIKTTTPVGRYSPQGDSPYGCADMAGNVWEWTRSLYRAYPYDLRDGREAMGSDGDRVLRGGAFFNVVGNVRCAYRYHLSPVSFAVIFGFRVAAGFRPYP